MTSDPWAELSRPRSSSELAARRVDENIDADFFWAKDYAGRYILLLQHSMGIPPDLRIPKLKDVEVECAVLMDDKRHIRFILANSELKDIFAELCRDIVAAAESANSEDAVIRSAISRMWRWHHLLRSGPRGILGEEQQKGLIGELLLLEAICEQLPFSQAVESWVGPLGGAKDFLLPGEIGVESKAVRGSDQPFVMISSEWQLDTQEISLLFLSVANVSRSTRSDPAARTLTTFVQLLRQKAINSAPEVLFDLESRLHAAGYRDEDDYDEYWWKTDGPDFFEVGSDFPRLEGSQLPAGLERLSYRILLGSCRAFTVERTHFLNSLKPNDAE